MRDPDYHGFWEALPHVAMLAGRKDVVDAFRHQYREEIFGLMAWMQRVGLVGAASELHANPPDECDLCSLTFLDVQWFIDGLTSDGGWANMCPRCFLENGHSIGWGTGQLYLKLDDGNWRLVSGGDPNAMSDGDPDG